MEGSAEAWLLNDQANEWVSQYKQCIEAVFLDYVRSGAWPQVEEFQQRLDVAGSDLNLWPFADALRHNRRWLGWVDPPHERIELRLRAWHELRPHGVTGEFARFVVHAVRTAADRYRANSSVLTHRDLHPEIFVLMATHVAFRRMLMGLVEQEAFYFLQPGPLMTSPHWERVIDRRRIVRFLRVETVYDYLLATAQLHVDAQPGAWRVQPASTAESLESEVLFAHRLEVPNVTNIYNINTAGMVNIKPETVNVIRSHIEAIGSHEPELAQVLARLTEALDRAPEFSNEQREELGAYITDLGAEVSLPAEQRKWHRIKAYAGQIAGLATFAPKFLEAWNNAWALIEKLKGQ